MKLTSLLSERITVSAALTRVAILLCAAAFTVPIGASSPATAATIVNCSVANTFVWAAFDGAGTAGTTYYVLEFSNIGPEACTMHGNASVWAISKTGLHLGKPASHQGVPSTVTLAHDGTAHAILGVIDTGAACPGQGVQATGIRVVPPGQTLPNPAGEKNAVEYFPVKVCAHQSSMKVLPVRSGTGIPLYTTVRRMSGSSLIGFQLPPILAGFEEGAVSSA
jgi:hypothetical protein